MLLKFTCIRLTPLLEYKILVVVVCTGLYLTLGCLQWLCFSNESICTLAQNTSNYVIIIIMSFHEKLQYKETIDCNLNICVTRFMKTNPNRIFDILRITNLKYLTCCEFLVLGCSHT